MIPDALQQIQRYLQAHPVRLSAGGGDARTDSAESEGKVVSVLQNRQWGFSITSPNVDRADNRSWYDIKIAEYFCDIKISALSGADNTNAKMAVFYFLTGRYAGDEEGFSVPVRESAFFPLMRELEQPDEQRDYYYIVINKNDPGDVFIVNLKGIAALRPAASNLPFQCSWTENRDLVKRDWAAAREFLLEHWAESVRRKLKSTAGGMVKHYPEYFSGFSL